jgi:predicted nucleic acid-binding protein
LSWFTDYLPERHLALDASAIINLLGCDHGADALSCLVKPTYVAQYVLEEITRHPIPGLNHESALGDWEKHNLIAHTQLSETELDIYIGMLQGARGTKLGSGESATLAVAAERGFAVVIDESKARKYAVEHFSQVPFISSLKLFISVAVRLEKDEAYARDLAQNDGKLRMY